MYKAIVSVLLVLVRKPSMYKMGAVFWTRQKFSFFFTKIYLKLEILIAFLTAVGEPCGVSGSFDLRFIDFFLFSDYFSAIRSPAARQLAGGFTIELGLSRALNDAFSCLGWKSSLNAST